MREMAVPLARPRRADGLVREVRGRGHVRLLRLRRRWAVHAHGRRDRVVVVRHGVVAALAGHAVAAGTAGREHGLRRRRLGVAGVVHVEGVELRAAVVGAGTAAKRVAGGPAGHAAAGDKGLALGVEGLATVAPGNGVLALGVVGVHVDGELAIKIGDSTWGGAAASRGIGALVVVWLLDRDWGWGNLVDRCLVGRLMDGWLVDRLADGRVDGLEGRLVDCLLGPSMGRDA